MEKKIEEAEAEQFKRRESKLIKLLLDDGYPQDQSEELAFYVARLLSDMLPLAYMLDNVESYSTDEVMDAIHMVFSNRGSFEEAYKLLMRETT
jgi:hypothetical protein